MPQDELDCIPLAVRVYPQPSRSDKGTNSRKYWRRPDAMFVIDTETTTDSTQRLLIGSYRFMVRGECLEEGLFFADDLAPKALSVLHKYAETHEADTSSHGVKQLLLLSQKQFLDKLFRAVYKSRALLVGFNLPFDLSRLGFDVAAARGPYVGGFSFGLWSYVDKEGRKLSSGYRPRVVIKHVDSKRALMGFTARYKPDRTDTIPEGSLDGKAQKGYRFRGHLLDLRTLAFALTDRGHSLDSASKAFLVQHGKTKVLKHGRITEAYVDYNRRDVQATAELTERLLEEYDKNPINLQETKAFSPASIGKAYLRAMGITPIAERHIGFEKYLGWAQTAFYGGRASAHIRKVLIPIVYTDFLSMYPTVNSLLNLWDFVIARKIKVVPHCQEEIKEFLRRLRFEDLFNRDTWKNLRCFVRVLPDGDILPTRGMYNPDTNDWQVAVNYVYETRPENAMWFALPDVVESTILTGKVPNIVDAFRLEPCGALPQLRRTRLRGAIEVDPLTEDFFKVVIEQRKALASRKDLPEDERERLSGSLKVTANATSYGIYAEMNRQETDSEMRVRCYGIDSIPFHCRVANPERPGHYCFPPLASLITGAARLMLALLEKSVTDLGGTYAMEDTDSMAIVATESGGLVSCPGGTYRMQDGSEAVQALSWKQVEQLESRFKSLSPYNPAIVSGSILKIEEDNFDVATAKQQQLWCYAISAKRYALFTLDENGNPILLRWSEHGLGHLLNPTDPTTEDRDWIKQVWLTMILKKMGRSTQPLKFETVPAVGRVTVSSPSILQAFDRLNKDKEYSQQIKPFNFLLSCHVNPLGHPLGVDPTRFHLISPYETNPIKWLQQRWIDQYSGKEYRISTGGDYGSRQTARIRTFQEVVEEYEYHPESKCADASGNVATRQSVGLLQRRRIKIDRIRYIGKESNRLEDVDSGLIHSAENVYTEYEDQRRDEWETKIRPALKEISLSKLQELTGLSRRTLISARTGRRRPHPNNQRVIRRAIQNFHLEKNSAQD